MEALSETSLLADYYNNADYGLSEEAGQYRRELDHGVPYCFLRLFGLDPGLFHYTRDSTAHRALPLTETKPPFYTETKPPPKSHEGSGLIQEQNIK